MTDAKEMEFTEVKAGEFVKWEKVGQEAKGIFVEVEEREDRLNGGTQKVYTFEAEDGTDFLVARKSIDSGMKKIVKGQWVKIVYAEDIESKTAGNNPFKLIKVYEGQIDEAWVAKNTPQDEISVETVDPKSEDMKDLM